MREERKRSSTEVNLRGKDFQGGAGTKQIDSTGQKKPGETSRKLSKCLEVLALAAPAPTTEVSEWLLCSFVPKPCDRNEKEKHCFRPYFLKVWETSLQ